MEKIDLITRDGYKIGATRYNAQNHLKANIVIAGATGVPQRFYRQFAEYASDKGFTVMTLDYRGIGESKPETLKGFNASYLDWARQDLAAAVDKMATGSVPLFIVGHSLGGHLLGLLPNHFLIDKCYTFATGAGWTGWMPYTERIKVKLMWHVILPIIVMFKGYMGWSSLGLGEDLPLLVYRQWKYWCRFPHYFFDDPEAREITKLYKEVKTPIKAANSLDDRWATPKSRDAFMQGYVNSQIETWDIYPKPFNTEIGHMGYFKPFAKPLWDDVLEWLIKTDDNRRG